MNAVMATQHRLRAHVGYEALSPELALVDPVLAVSARQQLPEANDSLSLTIRIATSASASDSKALLDLARAALATSDDFATPRIAPRSRSWRTLVAVAAATVVGLLLLDMRVPVEERATIDMPRAVPSIAGNDARGLENQPPSTGDGAGRRSPEPRRFAWAPTNSSGYHVELFRGSEVVFSEDTSAPQVTIPARWTYGGQRRSLGPGEYRWYVWPVVSGRRAAQAIVQAKLVVPTS